MSERYALVSGIPSADWWTKSPCLRSFAPLARITGLPDTGTVGGVLPSPLQAAGASDPLPGPCVVTPEYELPTGLALGRLGGAPGELLQFPDPQLM